MMSRKEMKGSHVVSTAAIKLGSRSQELIIGLPQVKHPLTLSLSPEAGRGRSERGYHFKMS
jgi:hypothetical protein